MTEDWRRAGFGLYLHWPFCQAKCPYCDFNSHVTSRIDQGRWLAAYLSEIDRFAALTEGRILTSVFFGGGTPSMMEPDLVAAILDRIRRSWRTTNDFEVTLEANPTSVEAGRFRGYRDGGVNRVSMGLQALNDADLKALGRLHTVAEARTAFDIARETFGRVSFDLIYARQDQSLPQWRSELTEALSLAVDHLSLYQLTIEPGTAFGARHAKGGLRGLPDDDLSADMYEMTQEICDAHGMPAYEISNHARPDAQSRHNLIYWRYGDYVGIGPGAHGRLTLNGAKCATEAHMMPGKWLADVEAGTPPERVETVTAQDQAQEFLLMGLRLSEGVSLDRFTEFTGKSLSSDRIADLQSLGLVATQGGQLAATAAGRPVLNGILRDLLIDQ